MTSATCVAPMMQVKTTITPRARTTNGPIGEKHQMGAQWLGGRAEKTSTIRWNSTRRRRAAVLRILAALFLAMLPAPVGARVSARNSPPARAKKVHVEQINTNYICAGTLEKSPTTALASGALWSLARRARQFLPSARRVTRASSTRSAKSQYGQSITLNA